MIEVENLTRKYGDLTAIKDLTFEVEDGEVVGFLGANGAGKTTTLRILACYLPATFGRARIDGLDVATQSLEVRRRIGYLPESVPLYNELRVNEYLSYRAALKGVAGRDRNTEVERVTERCKLSDRFRQTIGTLSRGYQQRVGLADALLASPRLLILDEPTSGLDPIQRLEVRGLLNELRGEHTIFLSTHVLSEVEAMSSRVLILRKGQLVPEADIGALRARAFYRIATSGPENEILAALQNLTSVARVVPAKGNTTDSETEDDEPHGRWDLEPAEGADPRDDLVVLFASRRAEGWRLLELKRRAWSLEEVFARTMASVDERQPGTDS